MAKKILFKKESLSNLQAPVGYEFVGLGENGLNRVGSDGSSLDSVPEKCEVISFSVLSGFNSLTKLASKGFSYPNTLIDNRWDIYGKNLLWKVVDSNSNVLGKDLQFETTSALSTYLDNFSVTENKDIVVKGYYYKSQSREKFRIVGRNYAYWSLVGLSNYGRMCNGRVISPSTNGQLIIDYFNSEFGVGTASGEGLVFTSNKSLYANRFNTELQLGAWGQETGGGKGWSYVYGVTPGGDYLKLTWGGATQSPLNVQNDPMTKRMISVNRNGGIDDGFYGDIRAGLSFILVNKLNIKTQDYDTPNFINCYCIRPMGQDTFILSHNSEIKNDDKVFMISEPLKGTSIIQEITVHDYIDGNNFGDDISTDLGKTQYNRFGNIYLEDIGKGSGMHKGITLKKSSDTRSRTNNTTNWRVAWGKNGNYTISDDYIWVRGSGHFTTAFVNREL